ncbi:MAG: S-layer homology domain-containing protein [Ruminococcaceae bacterium]|nr:S-layer homology domain-containing protein [Oscillospiraceae bacterium]
MNLKRLICGVVGVTVLSASLSISAADFPDVKGHWSETYVNAMVKKGYIKGYEDGTFRPDKTVTNTESLILLARMLGVDSESNEGTVDDAVAANSSVLAKYKSDYKKEISYLLYREVIDESDLSTYISDENKSKALLRYQCAMLLTKLMGADEEIKEGVFLSSSYADTAQIPSEARPYVEYVRKAKIMEGMGTDSYGDPIFGPKESVTRGQMAKMLSSLISVLNVTSVSGTISDVDTFNDTVTVKNKAYNVEEDTIIKLNGEDAALSDLSEGMDIIITMTKSAVSMIEANSVEEEDNEPTRGLVVSANNGANGKELVISDTEDTTEIKSYEVSDDVKVVIDEATDTFTRLKSGQYVEVTFDDDGVVIKVETLEKSGTAYGKIVSKNLDSQTPTITVSNTKGEEITYEISVDGASITRNGQTSNLFDLVAGDSVTLKLTYGKVKKISAESESQSSSGSIKSITHSTSGTTLVIENEKNEVEYTVGTGATILIDGTDGTVYDLRPGCDVKFRAESTKLTKIETTKAASSNSIEGTVTSVQTGHNLLMVKVGTTDVTVGITNSTKIIKSSTGANIKLSAIDTDSKVTVTGSNATGMFIATVIIVH